MLSVNHLESLILKKSSGSSRTSGYHHLICFVAFNKNVAFLHTIQQTIGGAEVLKSLKGLHTNTFTILLV